MLPKILEKKHWKGIINMKYSAIPKAYSKDNIENYLKIQEIFLNNVSILKYYLDTYNSDENYVFNEEKEVYHSPLKQFTSNIPIIRTSSHYSKALYGISHPV